MLTSVSQPFVMLKDPIVFILTAYLSVVYFLLFGWLSAYPVIFSRIHGLNLGENGLCFIPICVGIISGGMIALLFGKRYQHQTQALGHYPPAEERLLPRTCESYFHCLCSLLTCRALLSQSCLEALSCHPACSGLASPLTSSSLSGLR